jgi:hypothetical protein
MNIKNIHILLIIMNPINDFVCTLINNREKIIEKLVQNYSYQYLHTIFTEINNELDPTIQLIPNDKKLYRMLTGQFNASRYDKSSIDWLPSEEIIDGIISIAKYYDIKHIEEIYTGLGMLSALLSKKINTIEITAADTFDNISTCNKLGLFQIAKRGASDYKYYEKIKVICPDMVISTYYPEYLLPGKNLNFFEEILGLVNSYKHKIIILILPNTCALFYNYIYYHVASGKYNLYSYHIKALDKYFFVGDLMKNYYKSFMLAHILVRSDCTNPANKSMNDIFSSAIFPVSMLDTQCILSKWLITFYDLLSPKLVKNIYKNYDTNKLFDSNKKVKELTEYVITFENINIPQYIYEINEFLFWAKCIHNHLYFVFDDRIHFYNFYITAIGMEKSEIRKNFGFPQWIDTRDYNHMQKYIYLGLIKNNNNEWQTSRHNFLLTFDIINEKNKKALFKNKN